MNDGGAGGTPNARCPRCGGDFHCGAGEAQCACFELKLAPALREQLAQQYGSSDCLCIRCLVELQAQALPPADRQSD